MNFKIRIGTRKSKLAMWQAEFVAHQLNANGVETEIVPIDTKGDQIINKPFAEIGSKGIFTEELERKLFSKEIDIAIHSAKDLQSSLPEGLSVLAYSQREIPNDVVVSCDPEFSLATSHGKTVGTSSLRRRAMIRRLYPNLKLTDARGNLQTRINKMEQREYDAIILAYAGVHRMNYDNLITEKLPLNIFTPPPGQGCIAVECATSLAEEAKNFIKTIINHRDSEICVSTERAFLRTIEGGCSIPIFGYATLSGNMLELTAGIIHPDGSWLISASKQADQKLGEVLGANVAEKILSEGGDKILSVLKPLKNQ